MNDRENFLNMLKNLMEMSESGNPSELIEEKQQEIDERLSEHREHIIRFLKMDRERIILQQQNDMMVNNPFGFSTEYKETITTVLELTKIIKLLTEEELREKGA